MVVAVRPVRMVEVSPYDEVDVVAVRRLLVPAGRSMDMPGRVGATLMRGGAGCGIAAPVCDAVLVNVTVVNVVQMAIMEVVGVALV